ncbi:3,4-dihydroxy-2-butanone-4-phosphate synthase [Dermabacter hominis]
MSFAIDLTPMEEALEVLARGEILVVLDDENRENEGDLIMAAELASPEKVGFFVRHSSGYLCAPMTAERAAALELPLMVPNSEDPLRTAYTISCDARAVEATGISAVDRAITARTLATGGAAELIRPGHVLPLIARDGGVRERPGHTEAAVELTRLAGLTPVGLIGEVVYDDGSMMHAEALADFAREHGLGIITIEQLTAYLEERDAREAAQ